MLQFKILSGKQAGTSWVARRFPVQVGRGPGADLRLEEDGLWDHHARLDFQPEQGVILRTQGEALATVNDLPVQQAVLRNGDLVELGSLKLQFWLSETRQGGLALRDALTWGAVALAILLQISLLYWLLSGRAGG